MLLGSTSSQATKNFDCSNADHGKTLRVVGLTDDGFLVCFNEQSPRHTRQIGYVGGLVSPDTRLVGIDFRVQDGELYGVGDGGGVYKLDTTNAAATQVSVLTQALNGTSFGVDFNPAADRLRIVSDTGQNLRHNVNAGGTTLADGGLNYTAGIAALGIVGAAYTNNDLDPQTATTLFDLDVTMDQIAVQAPPNNGSLGATGRTTIDADAAAGFDIFSELRGSIARSNRGYAVLSSGGYSAFYRVSLLTGTAQLLGTFRQNVTDIAVPLDR
ncbi:hypothetical protein HNQ60_005182 [Povalibacter uvarum]|uniref:DUF4394 domain-containing protein n=1 Tax=Povalibacter uvarum TaxID=732238 RepID=A0A841HVN7_9GAMM|nr:DUF4394 domain-containing protein [Povalibacter uvarum]MBB6096260.1 hypothetical protein [Povalibacter uvarum]